MGRVSRSNRFDSSRPASDCRAANRNTPGLSHFRMRLTGAVAEVADSVEEDDGIFYFIRLSSATSARSFGLFAASLLLIKSYFEITFTATPSSLMIFFRA